MKCDFCDSKLDNDSHFIILIENFFGNLERYSACVDCRKKIYEMTMVKLNGEKI
jgi:hypothetical protein